MRPWPSAGSRSARPRPSPIRPRALSTVACTSSPTTTWTGGAPTSPRAAASQPFLASTASRAAARQVALAIDAPETKLPEVSAGRPSSWLTQRMATASRRVATGDMADKAVFWSHAARSHEAATATGHAPPVTNPK